MILAKPRELKKRAVRIALANSFEIVAKGWMDERKTTVELAQYEKTLARFNNDVLPWLSKRPITNIDAPEILAVLKRIDGRGARYTSHRVRSEISRVFRYGIKEDEICSPERVAAVSRHMMFDKH